MSRLLVLCVVAEALVSDLGRKRARVHCKAISADQLTDAALFAARSNPQTLREERKALDDELTARAWHAAVNASASDAARLHDARAALIGGKVPRQLAAACAVAHAKLGDVDACADRVRLRVRIFLPLESLATSRRRRRTGRGAAAGVGRF